MCPCEIVIQKLNWKAYGFRVLLFCGVGYMGQHEGQTAYTPQMTVGIQVMRSEPM